MPFHHDWVFLRAAVPDLQRYVISSDLYGPLRLTAATPGSIQTPQLTIGSLVLSLTRLSAGRLTGQERVEFAELTGQIEQVKKEWRANWAAKAAREHTSRMNLWRQYLFELRSDPRQQTGFYETEIRNRTILNLLLVELLDELPQSDTEQLKMFDSILHGLTRESDFVWEPEVRDAFPKEDFWFLWAAPK